jgi:hypothetical protein
MPPPPWGSVLQVDWGWGVVVAVRDTKPSTTPSAQAAAAAAAAPTAQYAVDVLLSMDARLGGTRRPAPVGALNAEFVVVAVGVQLLAQVGGRSITEVCLFGDRGWDRGAFEAAAGACQMHA